MSLLDELGIKPVINASATLTRLGGSIMPPEVLAAMEDASRHWVDLNELQRRIGEELATLTRNEAAYVATGAAAGIALAVAACVTGDDPAKRNRLPDCSGMKSEVIVHKSHRNGYDHAVRMVGIRLIEIGSADRTTPEELEAALNENTACVVWFQGAMTGRGDLPLEEVIAIAKRCGVPVIVDAAAQLPPAENLWRFTRMGAVAAIFSGGKDLRGPQTTGLVVGEKWLIEGMRPHGSPNASLGRPMKVGKEEMAGLLAAVRRYLTIDYADRLARDERVVACWCEALGALPGVTAKRSWPNEAGQPLPRAEVRIDPTVVGFNGVELVRRLWDGDPRIAVADHPGANTIFLNPMTLTDDETEVVEARLIQLLKRGPAEARASSP